MSNNIYYFTAKWCGPCKSISGDIQLLNDKYSNVNFYKIDVDDENNNDIINKYEITSIPSFLFFKDGKMIKKITGTDIKTIEKLINDNFN